MIVDIVGPRQSGKTEALLAIGLAGFGHGKKVLYVTDSHRAASEAFGRFCDLIPASSVRKVFRGNGNQHVSGRSGGSVWFFNHNANGGRGHFADVLLLDGPEKEIAEPFVVISSRVYRSVTK